MKILIAPLNWGLGHAARCVPLVRRYLADGNEVVIGGDGESLILLRKSFPQLRWVRLAQLNLRYSSSGSQVGAMVKALPQVVRAAIQDHQMVQRLVEVEGFDLVISDNRFGLYLAGDAKKSTRCIYMTHQLTIAMPRALRWLEPIGRLLHAIIIKKYDACYVPDFEGPVPGNTALSQGLSGRLGHDGRDALPHVTYIGPLSRFSDMPECAMDGAYDTVAVLSGIEPQRTMLENDLINRLTVGRVLLVRGLMAAPPTVLHHRNITMVPYMDDRSLAIAIRGATKIFCRSGYSSVMDMYALGVLTKTEWIPTPGQSEQEYLADYIR